MLTVRLLPLLIDEVEPSPFRTVTRRPLMLIALALGVASAFGLGGSGGGNVCPGRSATFPDAGDAPDCAAVPSSAAPVTP